MNTSYKNIEAGTWMLALRLVLGWTYFSAFFRRTILADKLDPDTAAYIGIKFNHFLPQALGIKPLIRHLLENPELLWWNMLIFTLIEGLVGLFLMLGLFTRLMSIGVFSLALGILLGSGWLGTTCLDEWQIGILGLASAVGLFFAGGGRYSLDFALRQRFPALAGKRAFAWFASGPLPLCARQISRSVLLGSLVVLGLSLSTNQIFHGGLWGPLHNMSVRPKLEIKAPKWEQQELHFQLFRSEGVDVYGSWLIGLDLYDQNDRLLFSLKGEELASLSPEQISNHYIAKIAPSAHSLLVPLGAQADLAIPTPQIRALPPGRYRLRLSDISGASWEQSWVH